MIVFCSGIQIILSQNVRVIIVFRYVYSESFSTSTVLYLIVGKSRIIPVDYQIDTKLSIADCRPDCDRRRNPMSIQGSTRHEMREQCDDAILLPVAPV